jgi:hypothetical protein
MNRLASLALLVAVAVVGCRSSTGPYPAKGPKGEPLDRKHSILYLDRSLQKVLLVTRQHADRAADGRMVVEVDFRNTQPKPVHVQIRTLFRTAGGGTTEKTPFVPLHLAAHEVRGYRISASNADSESYLMQVRRMDPKTGRPD